MKNNEGKCLFLEGGIRFKCRGQRSDIQQLRKRGRCLTATNFVVIMKVLVRRYGGVRACVRLCVCVCGGAGGGGAVPADNFALLGKIRLPVLVSPHAWMPGWLHREK